MHGHLKLISYLMLLLLLLLLIPCTLAVITIC
jgi:hypothetical protein